MRKVGIWEPGLEAGGGEMDRRIRDQQQGEMAKSWQKGAETRDQEDGGWGHGGGDREVEARK